MKTMMTRLGDLVVVTVTNMVLMGVAVQCYGETEGLFTYEVAAGEAKIIGFDDLDDSYTGSVMIPSTLGGHPVTVIGWCAFAWCFDLERVVLPATLTRIDDSAFLDCFNLDNVSLPDNLKEIGPGAFNGCSSLASLVIPGSVTNIGDSAFCGCDSLTDFFFPANVGHIGYGVLSNCSNLKAIAVSPLNVAYCGLQGVLFDKGTNSLVQYPTGKVGSYMIPHSVTNICTEAFHDCDGLTGVSIGDNVNYIGTYAFYGCDSLTNVKIPDSVTSIDDGVFYLCTNLTSLTIGNNVGIIPWIAFARCYSLTSVTLGTRVSYLEYFAFNLCYSLRAITIPDAVTEINGSFRDCTGLVNVVVGNGVFQIVDDAFLGCRSLKGIYFKGDCPSLGGIYIFDGCTNATAYYLAETSGWGERYGGLPTAAWNLSAPLTVTFDAQGGENPAPMSLPVTYGATYGVLANTMRKGYTFGGWWPGQRGMGDEVTRSTVVKVPGDHTLYAFWQPPLNPAPRFLKVSPAVTPGAVNEGSTVAFSVTADDNADLDAAARGMSNVIWYVDGVQKQVTPTGAPNAITSAFTLKTDATTVVGVASRDVWMRAVALDRQGGETATNWTVRVNNVAASQTITFKPLPVIELGGTNYNPGASSSSGLTVAYSNSNPAVALIVDGIIHIMGAGTTMITASQPGNFDFKAATPVKQTLTVKARLASETPSGGGTVTGAGLYAPGTKVALTAKPNTGNTFLRWEDGAQGASRSLVMPNANVTVSAWFKPTTNVAPPVVRSPGAQEATVGVYVSLPLVVESESLPTVTVTGLPAGLAYVPAAKMIAGVPTAAVSNKVVLITARNVNKTPGTNTFSLTVTPLPAWAQGAFNGAAGTEAHGSGSASLSVTALGAVSGKLTLRGTNLSFSAKSYTSCTNGAFAVAVTAAVGKVSMPLSLTVYRPEITDADGRAPVTLSRVDGFLSADGEVVLWRNVWKDAGMVTVLTNTWAGYYTAVLPGGTEFGSGYLTFTVDKLGGVKTVGKLADGTAVSLGGTLVLDEAGRAFAVLYAAPTAYKGGGLFGFAEFFKADAATRAVVRLLDGEPFAWENLDPAATRVYGQGFGRELDLSGGWYDTVGNLYRYYAGQTLSVGTEGVPAPELLVGTNRHASVWWDPEGVALSVVTNRLGVMTGLSAPKAGAPVKNGLGYDYGSATNAVGLTVSLTRASGVFKGSFKAWFDYAATHTSKAISYEGVLTPEREDAEDGVAGRGFFLWADKSQYPSPQGKPVPYSFNWSYDLLLLP